MVPNNVYLSPKAIPWPYKSARTEKRKSILAKQYLLSSLQITADGQGQGQEKKLGGP